MSTTVIPSSESIPNTTADIKLHSTKTISASTFLGGPLCAAFLIAENYKSLNKPKQYQTTLVLGIAFTLLLFAVLFSLPESVIDKLPKQLIPLIYTAIVYGIVESQFGRILKAHKENGNTFFSGWRVAGVTLISLIIMGLGILAYAFYGMDNSVYNAYDEQMALFSQNESESLKFYDHLESKSNYDLVVELNEISLPKWEENIAIINRANGIENLPSELIKQNTILKEYCKLRIEALLLFKKAIQQDSHRYDSQLETAHQKIENILKKL